MAAGWRAVGGRLPVPTTVSTMHNHKITVALLGLAATATLAPTGALARPNDSAPPPAKTTSLSARPDTPSNRTDALRHAAAMRAVARHRRELEGAVMTVASPGDAGFSLADGAIGAGVTAALLLGAASVRRPRTMRAQ
jgi:hypothetical protein